MEEILLERLAKVGLSKNEAMTYITMLSIGPASVASIARETGIERTAQYALLDKLISKGLASYILVGNVRHFQAADPRLLIRKLKEKLDELKKLVGKPTITVLRYAEDILSLNENELKTYLSLLKFREAKVSQIAKEAKIDRTTCYRFLERLVEVGLVTKINDKASTFQAYPLQVLVKLLRARVKEIEELLPTMLKLRMIPQEEAIVELYKGKEGLKAVLRDVIQERKDYVVFGEEGKFQELFPLFIEVLLKNLVEYNMHERILSKESKRGQIFLTKNSEIRYLPDEYFSPAMTTVYGDKVSTYVWKPPFFATVIKNKDVADSFRSYFEFFWKIAKK